MEFSSINSAKDSIDMGLIHNCPVTSKHIDNYIKIFGTPVPLLKGKGTRSTPKVVTSNASKTPLEVLEVNSEITLNIDTFFVNKIPFFTSVSEVIGFTTVEVLKDRTIKCIYNCLMKIKSLYLKRGFTIVQINSDNEYAPLKNLCVSLNIT